MIREAIEVIAKLASDRQKRIEFHDLPDRKVAVDQQAGTREDVYTNPRTFAKASLADLASLRAWCESAKADGEVIIGRRVGTSALTPRIAHASERSTAGVPFFDAFIPKGTKNIRAFIAWVDLIRPGLTPKDASDIDACLALVTVADVSKSTVTQTGAAIVVQIEQGKKVLAERPFPKRITARIPFGDPSFVTPVTFSLTLDANGIDLVVHIDIDELEFNGDVATGPRDRFVEWARAQFAGLDGWTIMVGP